MTDRRGKTLIEMMVVVGLAATLTATAARLLFPLLQSERDSRQRMTAALSGLQLARQVRQDVRAAATVGLIAGDGRGTSLVLNLPSSRTVIYGMDGENLIRTVLSADGIEHRERYRLRTPQGATFDFDSETRLVAIEFAVPQNGKDSSDTSGPGWVFRIEAVLGRDHRFQEASR
ncbi:MAG: hypothetical protein KY476_04390 [Planctomycetes bacterium]|nr:hypothetical protein [Planctomycetota bacterium]